MSIIINHVNFNYQAGTALESKVLQDINIKISDGEFIGLIGHTGSGKSTLIQHLNGLNKATSGAIYYNGEDIYEKGYSLKKLRSKVGVVFQYPEHQLFETTVLEDVKFGPKNLGLPQLEVDIRAFQALKEVGITEDLLDASPLELSGGQKRRVAIAGILAIEPEILVLDEPTAGLDPRGREEILGLIKKIHKQRNCTVILVSHSMEDVAEYVDRIIVMNDGKVFLDGSKREVFAYSRELEKIGLQAPEVTYVMQELKRYGAKVRTDMLTVEEAKGEILQWIRKGGSRNDS